MIVIDANGLIMGRLASTVAKKLLSGEESISIVNAEKVVISGSKRTTLDEYRVSRERGQKDLGPTYPKRPDRIMKRTVRGMLPYKRARGRDAMSRLKVYVGVPMELSDAETVSLKEASMTRLSSPKYVQLGEICLKLGAKF